MDIFHHTRFQFPVLTFFLNLRAIHLQLLDYFGFLHTMELPMKFDPRIQPSIDYMDSHLLEELDLEDVARQSGYSLSSFYRFFQALTGFTLKVYIRNRRLAYAARQLVFTRRRILDIALDAGFHSQEVFHRAFVSLHGIPPGEYRRTRKASVEQLDRMDAFARRLEENHTAHCRKSRCGRISSGAAGCIWPGWKSKPPWQRILTPSAYPAFGRNRSCRGWRKFPTAWCQTCWQRMR